MLFHQGREELRAKLAGLGRRVEDGSLRAEVDRRLEEAKRGEGWFCLSEKGRSGMKGGLSGFGGG